MNLFPKEIRKILGKLENENPETLTIDDACALKTKGYAYRTKVKEEKIPKLVTEGTQKSRF